MVFRLEPRRISDACTAENPELPLSLGPLRTVANLPCPVYAPYQIFSTCLCVSASHPDFLFNFS
jgi:hypothetical protein